MFKEIPNNLHLSVDKMSKYDGNANGKMRPYRMSSKISGLLRSRVFMRSFMAVMMACVLTSAPCLELFSAAPATG